MSAPPEFVLQATAPMNLIAAVLVFCSIGRAFSASVWPDSSFELLPAGSLPAGGARDTWEVQRTGRDSIMPRLTATCLRDRRQAHSGRQCLALSIPQDTVGFEFVTVGRRVKLDPAKEYEASVWVRWTEGPAETPARASAVSGHPSAIVSFWARHRDGKGDFAGRDEWLFDNRWKRLSFRFRATESDHRTLLYISLLPNQKPAATTVLVDDFELHTYRARTQAEPRASPMAAGSAFDVQAPGPVAAPWHFANIGGSRIRGSIVESGGRRFFAMLMGKDTSNYESAQLWQTLDLRKGVRYQVSCRMRWDNYAPESPAPIVNYGIYHERSRTWYGPVDQTLEKSGAWRTYQFVHVPPFGGRWKLYVQLNGWGNFGRSVAVSFDNLTCTAAEQRR